MILGLAVLTEWRRARARRRGTAAAAYGTYVQHRTDGAMPHCRAEILHAPGSCRYCDDRPDLQDVRRRMGLPFDPPEANGWTGNVAVPHGEAPPDPFR